MKRITTSFFALAAIFCAFAQEEPTVTTGAMFPVDHNVYNPSYYENVIQVSYDNEIVADNVTVTLTANGVTTEITPSEVNAYGLTLNLETALSSLSENDQFSINITGVEPAADTNDVVENVSGTYLLRHSFPIATATPEPGNLDDVNTTVKVTFTEPVEVVDIFFMSGSFMNQKVNHDNGPEGYASELNAEIKEDYWSQTESPSNIQVRLGNVKVNGGWIVPDYVFAYTHEFPKEDAKYLTYEPLSDEITVWDAYGNGWGFVDLVFDNEVEYEDADARLVYTLSNGTSQTFRIWGDEFWGDWSFWDNLYHVQVPLLEGTGITEDNLVSISLSVSGITTNGKAITIPTITYSNTVLPTKQNARKVNNTAGINNIGVSETAVVYNIQGNVILSNANNDDIKNLPAGLYIVNGKKVLVRN